MTKFLVDTDVIIWYSRRESGATNFLNSLEKVIVSSVTIAEVIQGALNKRDLANIKKTTANFEVIHIS